jgi:hypothetical protein
MKPSRRESLLMAIAQARSWADELANGRLGSFAVLARREGKAERHIRLLLPIAFLSPRIVSALLDGTAPADLTITALARALPWSWAEQEQRLGLRCDQSTHPPNRYSAPLLNESACADRRLTLISLLFSPASAARSPRGFGGGGVVCAASIDGGSCGPSHLPASVAFCDVETTGLGNQDRIVSFGGIGMTNRNLAKGQPDLEYVYLVFNPGTGNGRVPEQIHGFSASALRLARADGNAR